MPCHKHSIVAQKNCDKFCLKLITKHKKRVLNASDMKGIDEKLDKTEMITMKMSLNLRLLATQYEL